MNGLTFYEKPGCMGNQRQKAMLAAQGVRFDVRDLLSEAWTEERLRPFFGGQPVVEWFNQSAPAIKCGAIPLAQLDEKTALELMIADPILIRRPLLEYQGVRQSGFLPGPVLDYLGIRLAEDQDLQSCPKDHHASVCESSP